MIETKQINKIVQDLLNSLPPALVSLPEDIKKNLKQTLTNSLAKMDLVTREEFDAQTKVLARTREKLEKLTEAVKQLDNATK